MQMQKDSRNFFNFIQDKNLLLNLFQSKPSSIISCGIGQSYVEKKKHRYHPKFTENNRKRLYQLETILHKYLRNPVGSTMRYQVEPLKANFMPFSVSAFSSPQRPGEIVISSTVQLKVVHRYSFAKNL